MGLCLKMELALGLGFTAAGRLVPLEAGRVLPSSVGPSPELTKPLPEESPTNVPRTSMKRWRALCISHLTVVHS